MAMNERAHKFLVGVLGKDGARALSKAIERERSLDTALVPRAILAWLAQAARYEYEGEIPGVDNTYLCFKKAEKGFTGAISVADDVFSFSNANMFHVAASMAVALGLDNTKAHPELRDTTLTKLGKSIDLLVKSKILTEALEKKILDPGLGYTFSHVHHDLGDGEMLTHVKAHAPSGEVAGEALFNHHADGSLVPEGVKVHPAHQRQGLASAIYAHSQKVTGKSVKPSSDQTPMGQALWAGNAKQQQFGSGPALKTELPGQSHKPTPHADAIAPAAPQFQTTQPKPSKKPSLKVSKSEAGQECSMCGKHQFKMNRFIGCFCFRDMGKAVKTTATDHGFLLEFSGSEWDEDAVQALSAALRGS